MRERIESLLKKLREHDGHTCGDAPAWVIEQVITNVELLLKEPDDKLASKYDAFVLGAIRLLRDQCGDECDVLLSSLQGQ